LKFAYRLLTIRSVIKIGLLTNLLGWAIAAAPFATYGVITAPAANSAGEAPEIVGELLVGIILVIVGALFSTLLLTLGALAMRASRKKGPMLEILEDAQKVGRLVRHFE
jgi:hypothetical protein